jgi:hypothetical protein
MVPYWSNASTLTSRKSSTMLRLHSGRVFTRRHCEEPEGRRSNPGQRARPLDCFVASLLAMTKYA